MIESLPQVPVSALPRPRSRLIGRDREVADLVALVTREDVPIVTITGPGGVGKTRLALAVAREVADAFEDGVWLVPLAPVRDAGLVPSAIAEALGVREATEVPMGELVRRFLADRRALLVLDNAEQVVEAAAFLASVVDTCHGVTLLTTSRTRLRISDEREYPLPSLAMPDTGTEPTPEAAAASGAVRLFVERAEAVSPGFRLDAGNAAAVTGICRRLDGQPLAIELAAARIKTLAPAALLGRLNDSLSLLVGGRRDAPARQQTMRDAIAWSYDLLSEPERVVLRRLAVVVGGFSVEAAEAVCTDTEVDALAAVASLVDQSLVQQVDTTGGPAGGDWDEGAPSHRLLETVREFGLERLSAMGELEAVQESHAAYFMALAERRQPAHDHGTEAIASSDVHLGNWRAVLDRARRTGDRTLACRLANALMTYWAVRSHLVEGRSWFEWVLEAAADELPADLRAAAEVGLGLLADMQGDYGVSAANLERAVRHFRASGDAARLSRALQCLGETLVHAGDAPRGRQHFQESLDLSRAGGSVVRDCGWATWPLRNLSQLATQNGDLESATSLMEESLAVARATGQSCATAHALAGLADIARRDGRAADAAPLFAEALAMWHGIGYTGCAAMTLGDIGMLSALRGGGQRAAVLFGAQTSQLARVRREPWPMTAAVNARARVELQKEMGDVPFEAAFDRGRRQPLAAAVELALAEAGRVAEGVGAGQTGVPGAGRTGDGRSFGLSARETEVVKLLAAGKSDQEIADALFVSRRTASTHVSNILTKLTLANRAEAAVWAVRRGLA